MDERPRARRLGSLTFDVFTLFQHLPDRVTVTDPNGVIVYVNPAFQEATGYSAQEVIGQRPSVLKSGHQSPEFYQNLWNTIQSGRPFRAEVVNRRKSGELYFEDQLIVPIVARADHAGGPHWYISIARDITERKALEMRIRHMAEHDELTGLPNRRGFLRRVETAMKQAEEADKPFAVLFVDLNDFKEINDQYGHLAGDLVLAAVARKIAGSVRKEDVCARWGGDEFIVLLPGADLETARSIAHRIHAELDVPTTVDNGVPVIYVQASIGIAVFPDDGRRLEDLIRVADVAMYSGKGRTNGVSHILDREQADSLLQLLVEIPHAVRLGQFQLLYQPILDLKSRSITKAEALLRWNHPEMGMVLPGAFIGLAEQSRDIVVIDQWVVREGVKTIQALRDAGVAIDIAMNVSGRTLEEGVLPDMFAEIGGASPEVLQHVILEVTERAFIRLDSARKTLETLRRQGVRVSIDDFGTGYSCLAYFEELPADIVKIDRRFVHGIGNKRGSEAIIRAIIGLCAEFGCHSLAEGVETQSQLDWLCGVGCREAQGYWIAKPLPRERLIELALSGFRGGAVPLTEGELAADA